MSNKVEHLCGFTATSDDTEERVMFAAAAVTLGYELAEGTPKVSNVYGKGQEYEPGQPGDVRIYLPLVGNGININEIVRVWKDPDAALLEAEALPGLIINADNGQKLLNLIQTFDLLYLAGTAANIRQYSLGRVSIPDVFDPNDEEKRAVRALDTFVADHLDTEEMKKGRKQREKAARHLCAHWYAAQVAWVKAYRTNLIEIRNLWKTVPPAIKIARPGMRFPLVLERGPRFKELLTRWT